MLLLDVVHILAAVDSPLTKHSEFCALLPRAKNALNKFLVDFREIFCERELEVNSAAKREEMFTNEVLMFVAGTLSSLIVGRSTFKKGMDMEGLWQMYGQDLPLLKKISVWTSFLSASPWPCECTFSAQKATYTLQRNFLRNEKVKNLVFTLNIMRPLNGLPPGIDDAIEDL